MEGSIPPKSNRLLGQLPAAVYGELVRHAELVSFAAGSVVHDAVETPRHAFFPVSGLIGRVAMTSEGKSTEFTLCGREGMIGLPVILGGSGWLQAQALVHTDCAAYRVPAAVMHAVWRKHEAFQTVLLRYVQAVLREVTQVALCNKHHTVEQQLSRWLLTAMHRTGDDELAVTQSVISQMLGVRREGVTEAAGRLHQSGIVRRVRGGMKIVDPSALLERSCECYGMIVHDPHAGVPAWSPFGNRRDA